MANLAEELARQGHLVSVISSADSRDAIAASQDTAPASILINPKPLRLPYSTIRGWGTWHYLLGISRWIRKYQPDLVYVSMLKHDAYIAVKTCHKLKIPVVLRPEGAGLTGDVAWQQTHWLGRWFRKTVRTADGFVALSERVKNEMTDAGYVAEKIAVIPNGIPIPEKSWSLNTVETNQVLFVGRLSPEKGIDTLIKAWPAVMKEYPDARLKLVGSGSWEKSLRELAHDINIGDSIEFAGACNDVSEQLYQSRVFVLPSREEGLSIALLEAMATGIPTVASDIPGNRTLIQNDVTGRLFAVDQPESLAEKINLSLRGDQITMDMAKQGREQIRNQFSIRAMAESHIPFFRSIASS